MTEELAVNATLDEAGDWPILCVGPHWFRVEGYGIRYVDHRVSPMFFAERNGYRRGLHIGPHCFMVVTP